MSNKKPIGQYKIDWSHPLTKYLIIDVPIIDTTNNLVDNNIAVPNDAITTLGASNSGKCIIDADQVTGGYNLPNASDQINGLREITIIASARIDSLRTGSQDETDFIRIAGGSNDRGIALAYMENSHKLRFLINTSGTGVWTTAYDVFYPIALGEFYTFAMTYSDISGITKWYAGKEGEELTKVQNITNISGNVVITSVAQSDFRLSGGLHTYVVGQKKFNYAKVFKSVLTENELQALHRKPYSYIKPVRTVANDGWYAELFSSSAATLFINTAGIQSSEAVGNLALDAQPANVQASAINSTEALGDITVFSNKQILSDSILSMEQLGNVVINSHVDITLNAISSDETIGSADISPGFVFINTQSIGSTAASGTPVVLSGGVVLYPAGLSSSENLGNASILPGNVSVDAAAINSSEQAGNPVLSSGAINIQGNSINSSESPGTANVLPGAVTLTFDAIASAEALGNTVLSNGSTNVQLISIDGSGTTGNPTLSGVFNLLLEGIGSEQFVGAASVIPGALDINSNSIVGAESLGNVLVVQGNAILSPSGIDSDEALGVITLIGGQEIMGYLQGRLNVRPALSGSLQLRPALRAKKRLNHVH